MGGYGWRVWYDGEGKSGGRDMMGGYGWREGYDGRV